MTFIIELPGLIGDPDLVAGRIEDLLQGDFDEVLVSPAEKEL
jgi:hypothetical protein